MNDDVLLLTPPASPRLAACPGAPQRPARLVIPTLADHRGAGILPGDWIKPDPAMTRQETRRYVIAETLRWLTGRLCVHAAQVGVEISGVGEVLAEVAAGSWPAARLHLIVWAMEIGKEFPLPRDPTERYVYAGRWAAEVCARILREESEPRGALETMAAEFIRVDQLPGGGVIADFWNYSPFEALRAAPPLSDPPEAPAEDEEGPQPVVNTESLEDRIQRAEDHLFRGEATVRLEYGGLTLTKKIPVWVLYAIAGVVVVYLWSVAALLGSLRR